MSAIEITLQYVGLQADDHEIDLYDVAQGLIGFQRSLALTTHLVLNNEIITQAPSLDGAQILARPSRSGSWELTAGIVVAGAAALYKLGTAGKDTPIGHLIRSAYDYVVSNTLGFHVDYDKTLGQQYEELKSKENVIQRLPQTRFDSLIEKCEIAVRDMHRPIAKSATASKANIITTIGSMRAPLSHPLTIETYEYIAHTEREDTSSTFVGRVSSYNINTYKGRMYIASEGRPIPFELSEEVRGTQSVTAITSSLSANAASRLHGGGDIEFVAFRNYSRSGRVKSLYITDVQPDDTF